MKPSPAVLGPSRLEFPRIFPPRAKRFRESPGSPSFSGGGKAGSGSRPRSPAPPLPCFHAPRLPAPLLPRPLLPRSPSHPKTGPALCRARELVPGLLPLPGFHCHPNSQNWGTFFTGELRELKALTVRHSEPLVQPPEAWFSDVHQNDLWCVLSLGFPRTQLLFKKSPGSSGALTYTVFRS